MSVERSRAASGGDACGEANDVVAAIVDARSMRPISGLSRAGAPSLPSPLTEAAGLVTGLARSERSPVRNASALRRFSAVPMGRDCAG